MCPRALYGIFGYTLPFLHYKESQLITSDTFPGITQCQALKLLWVKVPGFGVTALPGSDIQHEVPELHS